MFPEMGELLERRFLPCYRYTEDHSALVASYYILRFRVPTLVGYYLFARIFGAAKMHAEA